MAVWCSLPSSGGIDYPTSWTESYSSVSSSLIATLVHLGGEPWLTHPSTQGFEQILHAGRT